MMVQSILLSNESYTHENWEYRDISVSFSRLYYIISGEAYYKEDDRIYQLKPGHVYLTPVKKPFTLYENPQNKLLHTYAHITTLPCIAHFTEIPVHDSTPLFDAVALWRKYAQSENHEFLKNILTLVLSCVEKECAQVHVVAKRVKDVIDRHWNSRLDMRGISLSAGYSREHITRSFLVAYGITPKQYVRQRSMNAALEQLISGKKIGEIAEELGYASLYSFSKAFKKHFGLSPQKYLATL